MPAPMTATPMLRSLTGGMPSPSKKPVRVLAGAGDSLERSNGALQQCRVNGVGLSTSGRKVVPRTNRVHRARGGSAGLTPADVPQAQVPGRAGGDAVSQATDHPPARPTI